MKNFPFNLLATAQTAIGKQDYQLVKYIDRARNSAGYFVSEFSEPIDMLGSVQPVNQRQYKNMGLDFKKSYIKIYDVNLINSLNRTNNADQVLWDGYRYQVAEDTPWFLSGGWNYVLCVRLEKE
jgi:hypothetical protein